MIPLCQFLALSQQLPEFGRPLPRLCGKFAVLPVSSLRTGKASRRGRPLARSSVHPAASVRHGRRLTWGAFASAGSASWRAAEIP